MSFLSKPLAGEFDFEVLAADPGSIVAAQIVQHKTGRALLDTRVVARGALRIEDDGVVRMAADGDYIAIERDFPGASTRMNGRVERSTFRSAHWGWPSL
jgi:hypothetical protein